MAVFVLVVGLVAVSQAQKDRTGQASDAATQAIISVENNRVDALVKSDTTALDSILADTYVDTDEHSHRGGKQDVFSFLKSGDLKLDSIKLSDMQVHIYGDAGVVIGNSEQAGKWRAVASHRSVAP